MRILLSIHSKKKKKKQMVIKQFSITLAGEMIIDDRYVVKEFYLLVYL